MRDNRHGFVGRPAYYWQWFIFAWSWCFWVEVEWKVIAFERKEINMLHPNEIPWYSNGKSAIVNSVIFFPSVLDDSCFFEWTLGFVSSVQRKVPRNVRLFKTAIGHSRVFPSRTRKIPTFGDIGRDVAIVRKREQMSQWVSLVPGIWSTIWLPRIILPFLFLFRLVGLKD